MSGHFMNRTKHVKCKSLAYQTWARTMGGSPDCIINPLAWAPVTIPVAAFGPTERNCCSCRALSSGKIIQGSMLLLQRSVHRTLSQTRYQILLSFVDLSRCIYYLSLSRTNWHDRSSIVINIYLIVLLNLFPLVHLISSSFKMNCL